MKKIHFSLIIKIAFIVLAAFMAVLGNEIRLGISRYIKNTLDSGAEVTIRHLDQFSKSYYENFSSNEVDLNSERFKKIYRRNINSDSSKIKCLVDKDGNVLDVSREGLKFPYISVILSEYNGNESLPVYFDLSSLDTASQRLLEKQIVHTVQNDSQISIRFQQEKKTETSKKSDDFFSGIQIQELKIDNDVIYKNDNVDTDIQELSGTISSYSSETLKAVFVSNTNENVKASNENQVTISEYSDAMEGIQEQVKNHFQEFIKSSTSMTSTNYADYYLLEPYQYKGKSYSTVMIRLEDWGVLTDNVSAQSKDDTIENITKGYLFVVQEYDNLTMSSLKQFILDNDSTYVLSFILIICICFSVAYMIVRPVYHIETAAKHIAKKDFHYPLNTSRQDELGDLARSIQTMSNELEKTINDLNQEMKKTKQQESIRKEFVSNFTHDIKTPLGIINGFSELIELEDDEKKRNEYIGIIQNETKKINELVKAMLDLSKLEAHKVDLNKEVFRLDLLIQESVDALSCLFEKKHIECHLDLEKVSIYADEFQIEMVINNFLSNALRYTNQHNPIYLRANQERFEIENIGSHIPEEELDKIWMTFHKVDKSRNDEGTGLGLSICKAILELHDFPYGVYNSDRGVVFYFEFRNKKAMNQ